MDRSTAGDRLIEFRVLGPIEARVDGLAVDIGGFRQRRLLALLLSRAGNVIESDALAEYVWDDDDRPKNAIEAARTYISRLRHSFSEAGLDASSLLVTQSPGYRLSLDQAEIDSDRFERLVLHARSQLDDGDAVSALIDLDDALGAWRGDPYQEFADRSWIEPEVGRLTELHRVAIEHRAAARLDLGAHAEVVGELQQLVTGEPLRARPVELLMLALFRSGRQAEALRVGSGYRRVVADVGLDPPESVTDLESRIAAADDELQPVLASTDTIRGYRLAEQIGEGSFSVVYRSVQPSLGREVAVKQIRAELADRPDFVRRFEAEAQTVAGLEHPHIVPLYDYWREPGSAYLVMRWLRGGTLESRLRRQRLDADESVTLATQIGSALATAHHAGVAHRDVRPANVFVDDIGNNYLGDFGIAVDTGQHGGNGGSDDVRGLGTVLFQAVTGKEPLTAVGNRADRGVSALRPDLPSAVEGVLLRAIIGAGEERYTTVEEFVDDYVTAINGTTRRTRSTSAIPLAEDVINPYKGLRSFQESDAADFRGRDRLVDRLLHQLAEPGAPGRLVAAVGPSGSGKSSLVRAGLLPRIRAGDVMGSETWFTTTMLPGRHPFEELEAALNRIATAPTAGLVEVMRTASHGISRAVNSVLPDEDSELLIVIDQFEELFTLADESERHVFLDRLVDAVIDDRPRLRVVITIRADHWHRPLQHPELAQLLETSAITVTPMAADELERAITDPARRMGVTFDPGLVSDIVAEVHDQPGALPLMQYLLTELFDAREAGLMELETYRRLGGVAGGLARRADELYEKCNDAERDGVRRLFSRLITPGEGVEDTRRRVLLSELTMVPDPVIDRFGAAQMLSFDHDPASREPTVEVAHEALIREWPRLRAWVDDDRDGLRVQRHLTNAASEWHAAGRPDGELYRGGRLETAEAWAASRGDDLTGLEQDFLGASATRRDRDAAVERRRMHRLRGILVATASIAVIAIVAGTLAWTSQRRADDNASEAERERQAAEVERQAAVDLAQREGEARTEAENARSDAESARTAADDARDAAVAAAALEVEARENAVIQQKISQSAILRDDQPTLSLLLAREAYNRAPGPETLGALLTALRRSDGYLGFIPTATSAANDQWIGALDDETIVVRSHASIDLYDLPSRRLASRTPSDALQTSFFTTATVGGGRFMTGTADGAVLTIAPGSREVTSLALPEGEFATATAAGVDGSVVVGYRSGAVDLFRGPNLETRRRIGAHPHPIVFAAISDDGSRVVTNDQYANTTLWDVATVTPVWSWTLGANGGGRAEAGTLQVASVTSVTGLSAELVDGGPLHAPVAAGWPESISGLVDFSNDGSTVYLLKFPGLVAFDADTGVRRWELDSSAIILQLDEFADGSLLYGDLIVRDGVAERLDFDVTNSDRTTVTPDGTTLAAAGPHGLTLWSLDGRQLIGRTLSRGSLNRATASPDGTRLAAFDDEGKEENGLYDVISAQPIGSWPTDGIGQWRSFTTGGELFAIDSERRIEVFDPDTLKPLGPPLEPQTWASAELSTDRKLLAVGDLARHEIRIYDVTTAELITTLSEPLPNDSGLGVWWIEFSPDGRSLVTSNLDGIVVWDTTTWQATHQIGEPDDVYSWVTFSPDGSQIAIGADSGSILLYDIESRALRLLASGAAVPNGIFHENGLEFSDDGRYIVVAGTSANLVDVETGQLVGAAFDNSGLKRTSVAHGGRYLVTGDEDRIVLWELRPDAWPELACRAAGRNMTADEWERFGWPDEPYSATCDDWPSLV